MMMMKMILVQICLSLLLSVLSLCQSAPQTPTLELDEGHLKLLSTEAEQYVNEEMKKALLGIKQMKVMIDKTEGKHQQLIRTLKQSHDKKMGAEQLTHEAEQKLQEVEQQCRERLRPMWVTCRPCLKPPCGSFYASTCRRSSSLSFQIQEFLRRMAPKLDQEHEQVFSRVHDSQLEIQNQTAMPSSQNTAKHQTQTLDQDLFGAQTIFDGTKTKVASLFNRSLTVVSTMRDELGSDFFYNFTEPSAPSEHTQGGSFALKTGLSGAFNSFMETGRSVLHEVSSAFTRVFEDGGGNEAAQGASRWLAARVGSPEGTLCRRLRSRMSECQQKQTDCEDCQQALLTECPEIPERYSELSEISLLLNASRGQYEEALQVLRTHTEHTLQWAEKMAGRHSWVTHISSTTASLHSFSLVKLLPGGSRTHSVVELRVLDSPVLSVSVPAELEPSDPAFVHYISREALLAYQGTLPSADHWCQDGQNLSTTPGVVVALEKIRSKVEKISQNAAALQLHCIRAHCYDACKAVTTDLSQASGLDTNAPPFLAESFDRVLLDAPCSGLGQRPNMGVTWSLKEVCSYPPLQRKLFTTAVRLLKKGGVLVYSTCTVTLAENEEQVTWALKNFPCLTLEPQVPHLGSEGMPGTTLSPDQRRLLQRFRPELAWGRANNGPAPENLPLSGNTDTIGFFIAKFRKT